jgi:hypothetical protein
MVYNIVKDKGGMIIMTTKEKNMVKRYQDCIDALYQMADALQDVNDENKAKMGLYLKDVFADMVEAVYMIAPDMHNLPADLQKVHDMAATGVEACEKLKRYAK